MKMTYTILVEVSVDERSGPNLIDAARQHYQETKATGLTLNRETFQRRGSSPEEEIQTALDALGELSVRPDLLQAAGVQINWSSATTARVGDPGFPDADPADAVAAAAVPSLDALEEPDPGLYLYRWPDGDVSIVYADSPVEALVQLDEFGEAGTEGLVKFDQFLANFKLTDRGAVVLDRLSEAAGPEFWTRSYPLLAEAFAELGIDPGEERDQLTAVEARRIKKAVKAELERVLPNLADAAPAESTVGRHLQDQMHISGPVADYFAKEGIRRAVKKRSRRRPDA
ncbi:MAG: hypothetical protein LC130_27200 [Bryobacterales bacterium]|nr:hypothetical protein [Bryobacterales bacterium]